MTLIINNVDRKSLELELKNSKCETINDLLIFKVAKRLSEHDITDISYINEYNELEIDI